MREEQKKPLISIIIPVYNAAQTLSRCLDSVLRQDYRKLEIILVDDGSTDNSPEIIQEYKKRDPRIILLRKPNGGVSSARNAGLAIASGDFLTFIDPDDYMESGQIPYLLSLIEKYDADISISQYLFDDGNGNIDDASKYYDVVDSDTNFDSISGRHELMRSYSRFCGHCWDKMYRRSIAGPIRFAEDIHCYEDTLYCWQCFEKTDNIVLGKAGFYHYVQSANSIMHKGYSEKYYTALKALEIMLKDADDGELRKAVLTRLRSEILNHEAFARRSLCRREQVKYADRFLSLNKQYLRPERELSLKMKLKAVILQIHYRMLAERH